MRCWLASDPEVSAKSLAAFAESVSRIFWVARALSMAVSSSTFVLWVMARASCWTRAALMLGISFWSESNSPRYAALIRSSTSEGSTLWNEPRSAASFTVAFEVSAACFSVNPSWMNMSPNVEAASRAARWDRPKEVAADFDQASTEAAWLPNTTLDLFSVSLRSEACWTAEVRKSRASWGPNAVSMEVATPLAHTLNFAPVPWTWADAAWSRRMSATKSTTM